LFNEGAAAAAGAVFGAVNLCWRPVAFAVVILAEGCVPVWRARKMDGRWIMPRLPFAWGPRSPFVPRSRRPGGGEEVDMNMVIDY
jgi:hypothetical protein